MKPAPFRYHAPATVAEATELLGDLDDAKVLAGGQSLVPLMALRLGRFEDLVDLNRIAELSTIERRDGHLRVGAMVRQSTVERSEEVAEAVPLLARATPLIGHFQIRNRGTVGGSLAHADPAAEYPAVALALDARFDLQSKRGARTLAAHEFFSGMWMTATEPDEVLVAVDLPVRLPRSGYAVEEVARRHGDFALVGAVCSVTVDGDGAVADSAVVLFGVGPTPVRSAAVEQALAGTGPDEDIDAVARAVVADIDPPDDIHGSATYRRKVAGVVVRRALVRALEEARNG